MGASGHNSFGPASSLRGIRIPTDNSLIDELAKGRPELLDDFETLGLARVVERTNDACNAESFVLPHADAVNETPDTR